MTAVRRTCLSCRAGQDDQSPEAAGVDNVQQLMQVTAICCNQSADINKGASLHNLPALQWVVCIAAYSLLQSL